MRRYADGKKKAGLKLGHVTGQRSQARNTSTSERLKTTYQDDGIAKSESKPQCY